MQPGNGVRRIHCTTHPVNVNRNTWGGRPQVPETLEQALLVNTPHTCLTPQKLHQCRRIVTTEKRLADAHMKNKFLTPQDSTRLRALLVWQLLQGHPRLQFTPLKLLRSMCAVCVLALLS